MSTDPFAVPEQRDPSLDDDGLPKCTVCRRDDVAKIDAAIRAGKSQRSLARDLLGEDRWPALGRHVRNGHDAKTLELAGEEKAQAGETLSLDALTARVEKMLGEAEKKGSATAMINAARELRQILSAKAAAQPAHITTVSYTDDEAWLTTREKIVQALTPYPQAREAVVAALAEQEAASGPGVGE